MQEMNTKEIKNPEVKQEIPSWQDMKYEREKTESER